MFPPRLRMYYEHSENFVFVPRTNNTRKPTRCREEVTICTSTAATVMYVHNKFPCAGYGMPRM